MRLMRGVLASLAFLLVFGIPGMATVASAQETPAAPVQKLYEVKTSDGGTYFGYLQSETPERLVIRTRSQQHQRRRGKRDQERARSQRRQGDVDRQPG